MAHCSYRMSLYLSLFNCHSPTSNEVLDNLQICSSFGIGGCIIAYVSMYSFTDYCSIKVSGMNLYYPVPVGPKLSPKKLFSFVFCY